MSLRPSQLNNDGQTLIALLIFMLLAIMLSTAAVAITIINLQTNTGYLSGELALSNAETGAENALLRLERDPNYSGETLDLVDGNSTGTATIAVSGSATKTIISVGTVGNFRRTITATASASGNVITLINWSETP